MAVRAFQREPAVNRRVAATINMSSSIAPMVRKSATKRRKVMAFEPGDVVFLKSGGQSLTVVGVDEDNVECMWIGEEGELFRETIPSVALTKYLADDEIDDDEVEDEQRKIA